MRRYKLKAFDFMAVFEATQAGTPHLHILARVRWIDQKWLSDTMNDLIQSPIVDIRRIDNRGRAVAYVTKYVGKCPTQFGHSKRYWKSKCYEQRPDRKCKKQKGVFPNGDRLNEQWQRVVANWITFGWRVEIEYYGFARAREGPQQQAGP